jgi:hypothetical protein
LAQKIHVGPCIHISIWEYSDKRLKFAHLLGQLPLSHYSLVGMDGPVLEKIMEETVVMVQLESVEVG